MAPERVDVAAFAKGAALSLAVVAFAGSWVHVVQFATAERQAWPLALAIATMPEVSVAVCILRLRSRPPFWQGAWAALVLVTSVAFTVRANLGVHIPTDRNAILVAVWPAWAAIGAAGLVEAPRRRPAAPAATRAARRPTGEPATAATAPTGEPATAATAPASRPATGPAMPGDFPRGRGREREQAAWFARELPGHPERTDEQWAARTGLSERTVQRRIKEAGGRPSQDDEAPALTLVGEA